MNEEKYRVELEKIKEKIDSLLVNLRADFIALKRSANIVRDVDMSASLMLRARVINDCMLKIDGIQGQKDD